MIGTLFGILIALLLVVYPGSTTELPNPNLLASVLMAVSSLLLLIKHFLSAHSFTPLQKIEFKTTPRIILLFKQDKYIQFLSGYLIGFAVVSYFAALDVSFLHLFNKTVLIAAWTVLLGVSLDALHLYTKRILSYINPYSASKLIAEEGLRCIQTKRESDFNNCLDSLSETGVKAVIAHTPSLALDAIDRLQELLKKFLEAPTNLISLKENKPIQEIGVDDKVSYTLFYALQRLEMINETAIEHRAEVVLNHLVTTLGKSIIYAAKYDFSMTTEPLHTFNRLTKRAQEAGYSDTIIRASLTLLQLSKMLIAEIDVTYLEIKETFLDIIGKMEALAKDTFKADKSTKIAILMQPFLELKELFSSEKLTSHQDTAAIQQDINRILAEFQTLELVMKTIPPMPKISEDSKPG